MKATNAAKMTRAGSKICRSTSPRKRRPGPNIMRRPKKIPPRDRRRPGQPAANPNVEDASHDAGNAAKHEEGECPTHRDLSDGAEVCLGAVVRFVDEEDDAHQDAAEDTADKGAEEGPGEDAGRERAEALHGFSQ